jgi:hypothetical protein
MQPFVPGMFAAPAIQPLPVFVAWV